MSVKVEGVAHCAGALVGGNAGPFIRSDGELADELTWELEMEELGVCDCEDREDTLEWEEESRCAGR